MNPFRLVSFSLIIACHFSFLLQSGKPIAARVYLRDAKGQWFFVESVAVMGTAVRYDKTNWLRKDAFEKHTTISAHPFKADLPVGDYTLTVKRGKEYKLIYFYGADYQGGNQTPPAWELYDMKKDPLESTNLYDNPKYAKTVANLKQRLASLRKRIGDDGRDFPEAEKVVQEFWNYDAADREKARKISNEFLQRRLEALKAPPKRKKK